MRIFRGEIKTLAVSMPPRAGKSYITSLYCAWWLAKNNEQCVMRNTVTSSLYRKFSYDIRDIIKSPKFKEIFPATELQPDKQNIDGWSLTTSKQGAYFGGGVGSNIIGFGANLAITDDLYSGFEQALSETYSENVHTWKQGSHNSRMEKDCPEIYIGTRWSKTDVIGKAVESGKIECNIVIQALHNGQSFCENVKSTQEYLTIKSETDSSIWDAEYQQEPAEVKGVLFPKESLKYFRKHELPDNIDGGISWADIADEGEDYFSQPFSFIAEDKIFIHDVIFTKEDTGITSDRSAELIKKHNPEWVWMESNNQGSVFYKWVRTKIADPDIIMPSVSTSNKISRIILASGLIKKYFYFLHESEYEQGSEYDLFMKNIWTFMRDGSSKHDDAPDSIAGLAKKIQTVLPEMFGQYEDPEEEKPKLLQEE